MVSYSPSSGRMVIVTVHQVAEWLVTVHQVAEWLVTVHQVAEWL